MCAIVFFNINYLIYAHKEGKKIHLFQAIEEGTVERQVKVLDKHFVIFFPSKQFLPISFQIQLLEYFPQNRRNKDKSS
jgi:hypothetical protein